MKTDAEEKETAAAAAGAAPRRRPTPDETSAAAVDLVTRSSSSFKRFALRYSLCAADAEDAYQRSLEILLRKAPTADRSELRAWLHTVIKHEALAVRRQRERALAGRATSPRIRRRRRRASTSRRAGASASIRRPRRWRS